MKPELYERIREISEREDLSINKTINLLLRKATQGKKK
jgi:hypothetical protein